MSNPAFQIPGLGQAKPNEALPTESFAPDLLAAAASIGGDDGVVDVANATQWAQQETGKVVEVESKTVVAPAATTGTTTAEEPQIGNTERNNLEKKGDAMDVDETGELRTQMEQRAEDTATNAVDQDANEARGVPETASEVGDGGARKEVEDRTGADQDVAHALEAALDGLLSANMVQNDEVNPTQDGEAQTGQSGSHPEWEVDSSPYESSSDSDSSDSSSDDDSEDEGGYKPLGIEETARLLMGEADGDGDGDGGGKGGKGAGAGQIRTKNEVPEDVIPKPDVAITEEMKIEPLGVIAAIVERTVVVKSNTPGEVQVLNIGSVLCRGDRTVIGALAETLGSVKSPIYTVGFATEEEIKDLGLAVGTEVFYPVDHAQYVFTQVLKEVKGSDASNLHDEEVAPDEMEFSDDEKEAEYKKQLKAKKRGARAGRVGGREEHGQAHPLSNSSVPQQGGSRSNGSLNYDEDEDGPYKPLARPQGYGQGPPSLPPKPETGFSQPRGGHGGRGSFRGGRDFRGRGRGGRGDRRRGRGGGGGGSGDHSRHGQDGPTDSSHPASYGVPQSPQNPHLPPPPYGAIAPPPPPAAAAHPWPVAPAPYPPPPPPAPVSYQHGRSPTQPQPPTAATFNYAYQPWTQNPNQPYQYPQQQQHQQPQQSHHHRPAGQQPQAGGYPVTPAWPGAAAPPPPIPPQPAPTGTYVNPAFFGGLQGQQPQGQAQPAQPPQYWGHQPAPGYGQGPK